MSLKQVPVDPENLSIDEAVDRLAAAVAKLSRRQFAALFVCCGEELLPLYEGFVRDTGWGDVRVLHAAAALAADFVGASDPPRAEVQQLS